ncbi:MAG: PIF1 family DEAD/DEAH box helicase [Candidatus Pacebacteria bacterium]|nr:PIF1 family DEAD/DEAH box helicase [Candidatus Paceibacterota bacterium]
MTQNEALKILKTGANIFLTGEPGSGKTHTINEYTRYLRQCGIEPAITASTGIAATHIGGMTIHSWSGIGIRKFLNEYDLDKIATSEYVTKRVRKAKVLVIDEVSMLSPETLSMVDVVCREVKGNTDAFGGMQVIFVGDFFQLPPVVKADIESESQLFEEEAPPRFAYGSPSWRNAKVLTCYLSEQYRQDDSDFLSLLSAIRQNTFGDAHKEHLEARKIGEKKISKDVPRLFSHNANVDLLNDQMLGALSEEPRVYLMTSSGKPFLVEALKKGCLSPEKLSLKIGASVMFTKNNPKEGFVNGTLGTVSGFESSSNFPIVALRNGKKIVVTPLEWSVEENGKVRAQISQLPLRLAWAITVHKSQGMSLDEAVMDLSQVFEYGQGYVALSRVRRLSGLHLLGWNAKTFQVHPEVLSKDESFRIASDEAAEIFGKISAAELDKMHDNFVKVSGGNRRKPKIGVSDVKGEKKTLEKMREKHPNAYRKWDDGQDQKLKDLFAEKKSIPDLMKILGRKKGAIQMRLLKFGLIEDDGFSLAFQKKKEKKNG